LAVLLALAGCGVEKTNNNGDLVDVPQTVETDDGEAAFEPSGDLTGENEEEPVSSAEAESEAKSEWQTEEATAAIPEIIEAVDGEWKIALENLLVKFPRMIDRAKYEAEINLARPAEADDRGYFPEWYKFHDLDGDDIPEIIITYVFPESEGVYDKIYKLFGDTYEQIELPGQIAGHVMFVFYTNSQEKLVAATIRGGYTINAIYFAEIQGKKLMLSDFIDSEGKDNFNGVKYDSFSDWDGTSLWYATDADKTLRLFPEIDCSDVLDAAKTRVYGINNKNMSAVYKEEIKFYDTIDYTPYLKIIWVASEWDGGVYDSISFFITKIENGKIEGTLGAGIITPEFFSNSLITFINNPYLEPIMRVFYQRDDGLFYESYLAQNG
jgi:hypothetical protein